MVLVDTSVWVGHLQAGDTALAALLEAEEVMIHPFVVGELACGVLEPRREILERLGRLPQPTLPTHPEVLAFIEAHKLMGSGVGLVDAHLLASARLAGVSLWTHDAALRRAARRLRLEYKPGKDREP